MGYEKLAWDAKNRKYVPADKAEVTESQPLMAIGTRYEHFSDLKDTWQAGVETIERIRPEYRSVADEAILKNLGIAIALLDRQIDVLSNFGSEQYEMRKVLDDLPRVPTGEYEKTEMSLLSETVEKKDKNGVQTAPKPKNEEPPELV